MLLQAMLGLQQDAPRGKLYVDPALPDWLPDVTLTDLRLGEAPSPARQRSGRPSIPVHSRKSWVNYAPDLCNKKAF